MKDIVCEARSWKKISLKDCKPNIEHPACKECESPNKAPLGTAKSKPVSSITPSQKPDTTIGEAIIILLEGNRYFDRIEYPALISLAIENKRLKLEDKDTTFRQVLEDKASQYYIDREEMPKDIREKAVTSFKDMIDHDIKTLENTISILRNKIQDLKKNDLKYRQMARWIVNYWGVASKFILGNNWEEYKNKTGRPQSFNSEERWKTIMVMMGAPLSKHGFKGSGTGNYYTHYKPKMLVILAYEAYLILHRHEAITARCQDLVGSREKLRNIMPEYFDLINLLYERGPIALFHWDNVACIDRRELLEKVNEKITSKSKRKNHLSYYKINPQNVSYL